MQIFKGGPIFISMLYFQFNFPKGNIGRANLGAIYFGFSMLKAENARRIDQCMIKKLSKNENLKVGVKV